MQQQQLRLTGWSIGPRPDDYDADGTVWTRALFPLQQDVAQAVPARKILCDERCNLQRLEHSSVYSRWSHRLFLAQRGRFWAGQFLAEPSGAMLSSGALSRSNNVTWAMYAEPLQTQWRNDWNCSDCYVKLGPGCFAWASSFCSRACAQESHVNQYADVFCDEPATACKAPLVMTGSLWMHMCACTTKHVRNRRALR